MEFLIRPLSSALFLGLFSLCSLTNAQQNALQYQYYCGRGTYGSPRIEDCHPLLESFAQYNDYGIRVFDEEQMRADSKGSWPGCSEQVGSAQLARAVQIPRYYTSNSCNFALLSYAQGFDHNIKALSDSSWAKVNAGGNFMINRCGLDARGMPKNVPEGGVVVVPSTMSPVDSALSLFMWESGSDFDAILNSFTNSPAGVIPVPGNELGLNATSENVTIAERDMRQMVKAAVVGNTKTTS